MFLHFVYFTVSYLLPCWTFFTLSVNGWLGINFSNRKGSSRRDLFWEYILLWTSQFLAFIQLHSTDGGNARGQCLCSSQLFESMCLKWVCSPAMPYQGTHSYSSVLVLWKSILVIIYSTQTWICLGISHPHNLPRILVLLCFIVCTSSPPSPLLGL